MTNYGHSNGELVVDAKDDWWLGSIRSPSGWWLVISKLWFSNGWCGELWLLQWFAWDWLLVEYRSMIMVRNDGWWLIGNVLSWVLVKPNQPRLQGPCTTHIFLSHLELPQLTSGVRVMLQHAINNPHTTCNEQLDFTLLEPLITNSADYSPSLTTNNQNTPKIVGKNPTTTISPQILRKINNKW